MAGDLLQFIDQLFVVVDQLFLELDAALAKHPLRLFADRSTGRRVDNDRGHGNAPVLLLSIPGEAYRPAVGPQPAPRVTPARRPGDQWGNLPRPARNRLRLAMAKSVPRRQSRAGRALTRVVLLGAVVLVGLLLVDLPLTRSPRAVATRAADVLQEAFPYPVARVRESDRARFVAHAGLGTVILPFDAERSAAQWVRAAAHATTPRQIAISAAGLAEVRDTDRFDRAAERSVCNLVGGGIEGERQRATVARAGLTCAG